MSITEGIVYYLSFVAAITVVAMAIMLVSNDMRNCTVNVFSCAVKRSVISTSV